MKDSGIQWTTHTFNPWRGCTKVSAGCAHCYAETLSGRNPGTLGVWGPNGTRVVASEAQWKLPVKWHKQAAVGRMDHEAESNLGKDFGPYQRPRVFVASLADVFEDWQGPMVNAHGEHGFVERDGSWDWNEEDAHLQLEPGYEPMKMSDVRARLFRLIDATPAIDWLLLTKRPENVLRMLNEISNGNGDAWNLEDHMPNVWLGTTVENRAALERIDVLRSIPAAVRFLSCEPLIEDLGTLDLTGIHWVIVGGESGGHARPFNLDWARSIVRQCKAAGVAVFVKQLGSHPVCRNDDTAEWFDQCGHLEIRGKPRFQGEVERVHGFHDRHAGIAWEWPADLQVREFPAAKVGAA